MKVRKGSGNKSGKQSSFNADVDSGSVAMEPLHVFDWECVDSASDFDAVVFVCVLASGQCQGQENTAYWLLFKS